MESRKVGEPNARYWNPIVDPQRSEVTTLAQTADMDRVFIRRSVAWQQRIVDSWMLLAKGRQEAVLMRASLLVASNDAKATARGSGCLPFLFYSLEF